MYKYFPATHSILSVGSLEKDVLPEYGLNSVIDFRLLRIGLNDTYLVKTSNGIKYILRIYRANWRSVCEIMYEIDVLNHLSEKGIPVSKAIPKIDGDYIRVISAIEGVRYAVLFTFADGNNFPWETEPESTAFKYGKAVGKIHNATQDFSSHHTRFSLDLKHLVDNPLKSIDAMLSHREDDRDYLHQLSDKLQKHIGFFQKDDLENGFCHGDFNRGNGHIADAGTITFFDFDCCGWGWRAYDIAVFRWGARLIKKEKLLWEHFVRGYTEERILTEANLKVTQLFVGIRHLWLLGLHTSNGSDLGFGFMDQKYFDNAIKFLRDWEDECFT